MKDPGIGAFGAIGVMLMLALKIATLSALPTMWIAAALIAGHALSRWCAVLVIWRLPYARADDSARARPVVERVARTDIVVASVFGLAPLALWGSLALGSPLALDGSLAPGSPLALGGSLAIGSPLAPHGFLALFAALAATVTTGLLGMWYARRLGGYTGDTLGATQQITETVFYLTMLAIWNSR
jgi:adenosylcobinamide-GDP ribazoletransferase